MSVNNKYSSHSIVLQKLKHYCAYQERSHYEVVQKMYELKISKDEHDEFLAALIQEDYLNELRFAELYVRSKFNQNKWGRVQIKRKLKEKKVSEYCINKAFKQIEESNYLNVLNKLVLTKLKLLNNKKTNVNKKKILNYCLSKGYESSLILKEIEKTFLK